VKINEDVSLAQYTTYGIGGEAEYFCKVASQKELIEALAWADKHKCKYFILGAGSNILISDQGVSGLVIYNQMNQVKFKNEQVVCDSGARWARIVNLCKKNQLSGLEFTVGIPGTVGGGVVINAGVGEKEIKDVLKRVSVYQPEKNKIIWINNNDCQFEYRSSRFKKGQEIILKAVFSLKKQQQAKINKKIKYFLKQRLEQPKGRSIGCIFKNPADDSAGRLIDKAGLKGKKIGGVKISRKHANFFINEGKGKAEDVLKLISLAKKKVQEELDIELEEEIIKVGRF
jgi:UDP-N-acetylmuramate dehydrogenase